MKTLKTILAVLLAAAVIFGAAAWFALRPAPMPAQRTLLYEDAPQENGLRNALEVSGVGGSRFFIQSPKPEALQTVSVAQFGASPETRTTPKRSTKPSSTAKTIPAPGCCLKQAYTTFRARCGWRT